MERGGDQNDAPPLLQAGLILESLGKFEEAAVSFTYISPSVDALQWLVMESPSPFLREEIITRRASFATWSQHRLAAPRHLNNDGRGAVIAV